jgi:hypothetical protein
MMCACCKIREGSHLQHPCRHVLVCFGCRFLLNKCPICNGLITMNSPRLEVFRETGDRRRSRGLYVRNEDTDLRTPAVPFWNYNSNARSFSGEGNKMSIRTQRNER